MDKNLALETLRSFVDNTDNKIAKDAILALVPELCESKDERIRKKCIELIKRVIPSGNNHSQESKEILDCIDYLERQKERIEEDLSTRLNGVMQEYVKAGKDEEEQEHRLKCYQLFWDALGDSEFFKHKEQKPILEVFGFKVGDAVRLKDGDGRKHIIKSFEEVEGVHGPNFYHVEFEDDSARDGIYPGEEYPNGYYTQMEKFEEEQKTEWSDEEKDKLNRIERLIVNANAHGNSLIGDKEAIELQHFIRSIIKPTTNLAEWSEFDKGVLEDAICAVDTLANDKSFNKSNPNLAKAFRIAKDWLRALPERFILQPKQEWSEEERKIIKNIRNLIFDHAFENGGVDVNGDYCKDVYQKADNFLKSLCPQPKRDVLPSLSEKEIICLKQALDYLHKEHNRYGGKDFTNEIAVLEWLITHPILVSDTYWKPSEEQILALRYYLNHVPYSLHKEHLSSLRDECEKLFK